MTINQQRPQSSTETLVTVTQFGGPDMQFANIREYAEWLWNSGVIDPDHAVDLHEDWGQAFALEVAANHRELDRLIDQFESEQQR